MADISADDASALRDAFAGFQSGAIGFVAPGGLYAVKTSEMYALIKLEDISAIVEG